MHFHRWPNSKPIYTNGNIINSYCDINSIIEYHWSDGSKYQGYCYLNQAYGYGEIIYSNQDTYKGKYNVCMMIFYLFLFYIVYILCIFSIKSVNII